MEKSLFNNLINTFKNNHADFKKLYEYLFPRIQVYISRKYNDCHLGEDVAQEFFLKLFKINVDKFIEHPTAWVFKACDNIAKTLLVKNKNDNLLLNEEIAAGIDLCDDYDSLRNDGMSKDIIETLKKLDKTTLQILIMHYWEGYNYKEIAGILGMRHDSVRRKASRAIKKLKKF